MGSGWPPTPGRLSLAWPLALLFAALVVYASLYPFSGWRSTGLSPWSFLVEPWPRYWTGFDVAANLLGYVPLGFLLAWAACRSGAGSWAWWGAGLAGTALSLGLEALQSHLPGRVPSNVDTLLNATGAWAGGLLAWAAVRSGGLRAWTRWRAAWTPQDAPLALVLWLLWPWAALYPASVPFGLGQAWFRVETALAGWLGDTPFADWVPATPPLLPLSPLGESVAVALGLWAPCLLAFALWSGTGRRLVLWLGVLLVALAVGFWTSALTYGPANAAAWLSAPVLAGGALGAVLGLLALPLRTRWCAVWLLLAQAFALGLLNSAPESPYLAESLDVWEQGRFIRFHGLSQWLGWLWPYAALWVAARLAARAGPAH